MERQRMTAWSPLFVNCKLQQQNATENWAFLCASAVAEMVRCSGRGWACMLEVGVPETLDSMFKRQALLKGLAGSSVASMRML